MCWAYGGGINWDVSGGGMGTTPYCLGGGRGWGYMHLGAAPTIWRLGQGRVGGARRQCRGCPRCGRLPLDLAVPRGVPEVRFVQVWVGGKAPGWRGEGIVCHGNSGVVLVPRAGVGQHRGRGVVVMVTGAVTRVGLLAPQCTAAPYRLSCSI